MHVQSHLGAFWTGRLLVRYVKIKSELFCNTPEFFMFGAKSTAKRGVTLKANDLKVKLYLCGVSLNACLESQMSSGWPTGLVSGGAQYDPYVHLPQRLHQVRERRRVCGSGARSHDRGDGGATIGSWKPVGPGTDTF